MIQSLCINSGGTKHGKREHHRSSAAVCGEENYIGTRNKRKHTEKMEIQKYCPVCRKKTVHKEKK
jgi:large subunit ribosomal protein L33